MRVKAITAIVLLFASRRIVAIPLYEAKTDGLPDTVSWQSAFWALVPLAMNSMTQPAGRMFGVHNPDFSFALRSSPILCACDALHAMCCLAWYMIQTKSWRSALKMIHRRRFWDATVNHQRTGLALLQTVDIFRIAMFALGALPQLIKLLGTQGLKWTTAWGSLFMGSFLMLEMLIYTARVIAQDSDVIAAADQGEDPYESKLEFYFAHTAGLAHTILSLYFLTIVAHQIMEFLTRNTWPYLFGLTTLAIATFISTTTSRGGQLSAMRALMVVPMRIILALSLGLFTHLLAGIQSAESNVVFWAYIIASIFLAMGLLGTFLHWYVTLAGPRKLDHAENGMYVGFVIHNILTALLYFALAYDPAGTIKPAWTDQLG